jgi:predicted AAA+ superfamily ATPase
MYVHIFISTYSLVLFYRNESKDIKDITENIIRFLDKKDLFIADKPVGVDSRVQDVIELLDIKQSNDVLLLGIWGMGGIGKTTIAKAVYNEIGRNFECMQELPCKYWRSLEATCHTSGITRTTSI